MTIHISLLIIRFPAKMTSPNWLLSFTGIRRKQASNKQQRDHRNRAPHCKNKHPRSHGYGNFLSPDRNRHVIKSLQIPALNRHK